MRSIFARAPSEPAALVPRDTVALFRTLNDLEALRASILRNLSSFELAREQMIKSEFYTFDTLAAFVSLTWGKYKLQGLISKVDARTDKINAELQSHEDLDSDTNQFNRLDPPWLTL